jgi:hypothetical protein
MRFVVFVVALAMVWWACALVNVNVGDRGKHSRDTTQTDTTK